MPTATNRIASEEPTSLKAKNTIIPSVDKLIIQLFDCLVPLLKYIFEIPFKHYGMSKKKKKCHQGPAPV